MSGIVREVRLNNGPLCPQSIYPANGRHQAATDFADRLYRAMEPFKVDAEGNPDPAGELPANLETIYHKVVHPEDNSHMILHSETTEFVQGRKLVTVETYFWKCHLCGHILPATTVSRQP